MNHYVYRITNKCLNKHYYGVRSSVCYPKDDLGVKYFSSSSDKDFIQDQKSNPQNYKYKIVMLFNDRKSAMYFEIKIHNKFNVAVNESFYNRCKASSVYFDITGVKRPEHSKFMKGKCFHSEEFLSRCHLNFGDTSGKNNGMYGSSRTGSENPFYGKKHSEETKKKFRERTISKETRDKISNTKKGHKFTQIKCIYCGKLGAGPNMTRYHFDNCKFK